VENFALDSSVIFPRIKNDRVLKRKLDETVAAGSKIYIPPHAYYETIQKISSI
jgi:hypothetical protein